MDPATSRQFRARLSTAAAADDDGASLVALGRQIEHALGIVPLARVPVSLWLHPQVVSGEERVRWPRLWVPADAGREMP